MNQLFDKIKAELIAEKPKCLVNVTEKGNVDAHCEVEISDFYIDFDVTGRFKFYRQAMSVFGNNPENQIDVIPEINIEGVVIYDKDGDLIPLDDIDEDPNRFFASLLEDCLEFSL